jgi:hypothetical protein
MHPSIQNCPVPPEQQPLNEYQSLQKSWFFGWSTASGGDYLKTVGLMWLAGWLFSLPFAIEALVGVESLGKTLVAANAGAVTLVLLVILRLYLGWRYVRNRLEKAVIEYEETGWYDGQIWQKTPAQRDQEHLISTYEVRPLMHRLMLTLISMIGLGVIGIGTWPLL